MHYTIKLIILIFQGALGDSIYKFKYLVLGCTGKKERQAGILPKHFDSKTCVCNHCSMLPHNEVMLKVTSLTKH